MILQFINVSEEKHWTGLSFENWTQSNTERDLSVFQNKHTSKELLKGETVYFRMDQLRGYQYYNFIHLDYKMIFTIGYVAILLNSKCYMH